MLIKPIYVWLKNATTVEHLTIHKQSWIGKVSAKYDINPINAKHQVECAIIHFHIDNIESSETVDPEALAIVLRSLVDK